MDVQQCLSTRPFDQSYCKLSELPLLQRWHRGFQDLVSHLWLELDSTSPSRISFFVALGEGAEPSRVCSELLQRDWPKKASSLLSSHRASYLGSMESRPGAPLRIHLKLPNREVPGYLKDQAWPGSHRALQEALREIDFCHTLTLCLELRKGVLNPNIGLEAAPENSLWDPIWEQGLQRNWLSSQESLLASSWSSPQDPTQFHYPLPLLQRALQENSAPLGLQRSVSHLKWSLDSEDKLSRKLYLWFSECRLTPGQPSKLAALPLPTPAPPPFPLLKLLLERQHWTLSDLQSLEKTWGAEALQAAFRVHQTMRLLRQASG